jgi:hypothetical protein
LVEQLVGFAISGMASDGTVTLLHDGNLTVEQARQIQQDLDELPDFASISQSLDQMERLAFLDIATELGASRSAEGLETMIGDDADVFAVGPFNWMSIDWNLVLIEGNLWYDRLAAAAELPDYQARQQALRRISDDLNALERDLYRPAKLVGGLLSRNERSELVAAVMLNLMQPALGAATEAENRTNSNLHLVRIAAALAVFRAEHGAYPETLDELVPGVIDALPTDLYNAKPYIYQRDAEGYLLYSAGPNGNDDGGSNEMMNNLRGRSVYDLPEAEQETVQSQIPAGADDQSIRVPGPAFEMPTPRP